MVYLLKMVIFHGYVSHNQRVYTCIILYPSEPVRKGLHLSILVPKVLHDYTSSKKDKIVIRWTSQFIDGLLLLGMVYSWVYHPWIFVVFYLKPSSGGSCTPFALFTERQPRKTDHHSSEKIQISTISYPKIGVKSGFSVHLFQDWLPTRYQIQPNFSKSKA